MTQKRTRTYTTVSKDGSIEKLVVEVPDRKNEDRYIPKEYFNLGMYFLVPLILGLIVGRWLDNRFDRENFFTILLMSLGVVSVFYNLYTLIKKR